MTALTYTLVALVLAVAKHPDSALLDKGESKMKVLDARPNMRNLAVTDTVSSFDMNCFKKSCNNVIDATTEKHPDFKTFWSCVDSKKGGACVEGKTWDDFPTYQMDVFDCGYQSGCLGLDGDASSLLEEEDETVHTHKDNAKSRILDAAPDMADRLVTDTVNGFDPKCVSTKCSASLTDAEKNHPTFSDTWKCLQTTGDGDCVEGKTWGDFSTYEMKIMDCGHHQGCLKLDLNGDSSFLEEEEQADAGMEEEDGEDTSLDSWLTDFHPESLLTEEDTKHLTPEEAQAFKVTLKNKMEQAAIMHAVLATIEDVHNKKLGTSDPNEFYESIVDKLDKVGDTTKVDPYKLEKQISKMTDEVANMADELDADEQEKESANTIGEVRKPAFESMSVDSVGQVKQLRTDGK